VANNSTEDDILGIFVGFLGLTFILIALVTAFWLAIPVAAILCVYAGHRIYQNSDAVQERKAHELTHRLYSETKALAPQIPEKEDFATQVCDAMPVIASASLENVLIVASMEIYEFEGFERHGPNPPPTVCNSIEAARYRDYLAEYSRRAAVPHIADLAAETIIESFSVFLHRVPPMPEEDGPSFDIPFKDFTREYHADLVTALCTPFFNDDSQAAGLFDDLQLQILTNVHEASKIPYQPNNTDSPDLVWPSDYEGDDLVYRYLKDTPLLQIFDNSSVPFTIPDKPRFEHGWILAPQGTGKTQLIQFLVSCDLERVARDEASVVVMDSQGDLIDQISSLKEFAPGGPLHDKLVVIEPDIDYPLALNIFDMGKDRLDGYSARDREQLANSTIDLLTYVFDALLGEGGMMTTKQSTLYRYVIRLLMQMPEATLATFANILKIKKLEELKPYREHIEKLHAPARDFFETQFCDRQFSETKAQVAWRLSNMLENTVFERMFSFPKSKLDLFTELNSAKIILINTDRALLGEERTTVFGRFFIAMLLSAAQERATLQRSNRLPVFCYIDEAHDYISHDTKITRILDQARKMNISMMLAHQRTKQIAVPNVLDALATTSVKFASTDNTADAQMLAKSMNTKAEFISSQREQHFALHIRRQTETAISVKVPFFVLENREHMSPEERREVRDHMRDKYASKYQMENKGHGAEAQNNRKENNIENGPGSPEKRNMPPDQDALILTDDISEAQTETKHEQGDDPTAPAEW
jgi:hypothetical protein